MSKKRLFLPLAMVAAATGFLSAANAAPSLPTVTQAPDDAGLSLRWQGNNSGFVAVDRESPGCGGKCYANVFWSNTATDSWVDTDAEPGVEYRYKVYDSDGHNGYSAPASLAASSEGSEPTAPTVPTGGSGGSLSGSLRTDKEPVAIARLAKPGPRQSVVDPAFKTRITRISASTTGQVVKPMYNTIQSFNANESLIMLYHTGRNNDAGHHLYDGSSYRHLRRLDIRPRDIEEVFWSRTDPNTFVYVSKEPGNDGNLVSFDVRNDRKTVLRDMKGICSDGGVPNGGGDPQMTSWNDDLIGLRCANPPAYGFTYRISSNAISPKVPLDGSNLYQPWYAPNPSASGALVFMQGDVLDSRTMQRQRVLDVTRYSNGVFKPEHAVMGRLGGADAYYSVIYNAPPLGCNGDRYAGIGALVGYSMETGNCRVIMGQSNGWGYPLSGIHPSALSTARSNLVAVSIVGYRNLAFLANDALAPLTTSELVVADTNPGGSVYRVAHIRTMGKSARNGGYDAYFGEPHPVISPSGTRVLFASDWYDSGSVDTFVVDLRP